MGWPEFSRLKWLTFVVAAVGFTLLQDFLTPARGWMPSLWLRGGVMVAAILAFNEYAFRLIGRANQAVSEERRRLHALHEISESIAFLPAQERNLGPSLDVVRRLGHAHLVSWLEQGNDGRWVCRAHAGDRLSTSDGLLAGDCSGGLAARALMLGRTLDVEDTRRLSEEERAAMPLVAREHLDAAVAVPATAHGQAQGVLLVGWRHPHRLDAADRRFLENAARQFAVARENLRLYGETQRLGALEERERLARDMHDGLAQALTYLKLKAEGALAAPRQEPERLRAALEAIRQGAVAAQGDVRETIRGLRSTHGGPFGERLAEQLHAWSLLNDIQVELDVPSGGVQLPCEAGDQALRVVGEALANVSKHSGARRVWVTVQTTPEHVLVSVADDGRGFDPATSARPGHFGMEILRERAAAVGGEVSIQARPDGGSVVTLLLPQSQREPVTAGAPHLL